MNGDLVAKEEQGLNDGMENEIKEQTKGKNRQLSYVQGLKSGL